MKRNELNLLITKGKYGDGTVHQNNQGENFKVLGRCENDNKYRWVQFFEHPMQYTTRVRVDHIYEGKCKNPYYPSVCGIGYLGEGYDTSHELYRTWENMFNRCCYPNDKRYKYYGAVGVRVDERWHNFSVFVEDMMYGFIPGSELIQQARMLELKVDVQLDKDIKVEGKGMLYSKDTVTIVTQQENIDERTERLRKAKELQTEIGA